MDAQKSGRSFEPSSESRALCKVQGHFTILGPHRTRTKNYGNSWTRTDMPTRIKGVRSKCKGSNDRPLWVPPWVYLTRVLTSIFNFDLVTNTRNGQMELFSFLTFKMYLLITRTNTKLQKSRLESSLLHLPVDWSSRQKHQNSLEYGSTRSSLVAKEIRKIIINLRTPSF